MTSSLELNIHQKILSELATKSDNVSKKEPLEKELIASKVQTRNVEDASVGSGEQTSSTRVYMVYFLLSNA